MNPTTEQRLAIETQDRSLIVEAGAGTGKTWVLVQRFIYLLETHPDWRLEGIIAITFTEKAAREMRTRLRKEIEKKALSNPSSAIWGNHCLNLARLQVSTIHSLCARLLRENSIAAEIDPRFQVLDEQEAGFIKEQAIEAALKSLQAENHPALAILASLRITDLRSEMASMLEKRGTLNHLFPSLKGPETLIARWETGIEVMRNALWAEQLRNTAILNDALSLLPSISITDPDDLLAESVRVSQQGCRDLIHEELISACKNWLQIKLSGGKAANWGGRDGLAKLKEELRCLREAADSLEKSGALQRTGELDKIAAQHLQLWRSLWEQLEHSYSLLKDSRQALDFDDLELFTDRLLHTEPRPRRLQNTLDNIQHLMVDEFQDVNLVQQRIITALAPIDQPGKLFVVGDAKQSIYRFRQAQVSVFNRIAGEIQAFTSTAPVRLSASFRTHDRLVQATNSLFDKLLRPLGESFSDFEAIPGPLMTQRETHPDHHHPVELLILPSKDIEENKIHAEEARIWEAQWIAHRLLGLQTTKTLVWDKSENLYRPFKFGDAAVLFRATTQLQLYEAEFKNAGLPYLTISGRGYFNRQEVQDLIALLAALEHPKDELNLGAALRSPMFCLNDETIYRLRWHNPDGILNPEPVPFREALAHPPRTDQPRLVSRASAILEDLWCLPSRIEVWELMRKALDCTSYEVALAMNDGETGRQRANITKFLSIAIEQGGVSIPDFLSRLRELKDREAREGEALGREAESGAVQLMSIHAAKGLEFPVLVVADIGRQKRNEPGSSYSIHDPAIGMVVKVRDDKGDWQTPAGYCWGKWLFQQMEEAERKRLFYVACTRAADRLILTGQLGYKETWLTEILDAWTVEPDGAEDEILVRDQFSIRIFRPREPGELAQAPSLDQRKSINGVKTLSALALPIPVQKMEKKAAASRFGRFSSQSEEDLSKIRPALQTSQAAEKSTRTAGYRIGNIVHRALAQWDCLSYSEYELFGLLENYAKREGVLPDALVHAVRTSYTMLTNLKQLALFEDIQLSSEKYPEIPFILGTPNGLFQGVIDLLYRSPQGDWRVVDWKTEWTPPAQVEENASEHLQQMAIYAQAAGQQLGRMPEVELCFLSPKAIAYQFSSVMIRKVWKEFLIN